MFKKIFFSVWILSIFLTFHVYASIAGDNIIISEVEYDAIQGGTDQQYEWFELYNPTTSTIDISGWTFTDGEGTVTIPSGSIAPGQYFIATHTATAGKLTNYPTVDVDLEYGPIEAGSVSLANGGDELTLYDASANIIDAVSRENHAPLNWNIEATAGKSIARSSYVDTDTELDWISNVSPPTPGTGNLGGTWDDFVITVDTSKILPGGNNKQFTIVTNGGGYNYNVDCNNDGVYEAMAQNGNYVCNYGSSGIYTIRIKDNTGNGTGFPRIYYHDNNDRLKIVDINQWGSIKWTSMASAFYGCVNLNISATDKPDLSNVTDMSNMFYNAQSLDTDISDWDVGNVTNMTSLFRGDTNFNSVLNTWDVSNVTDMSNMFFDATSFDQLLNLRDVSNVHRFERMFKNATSFNQDIGTWDMHNGQFFNEMFMGTTLSRDNYDSFLIGLRDNGGGVTRTMVSFHGGNSKYCQGGSARSWLQNDLHRTITDAGMDCQYAPTDIKLDGLDSDNVDERTLSGSEISIISSIDYNTSDSHTYTLVSGIGDEDNTKFSISGDKLIINFSPDYDNPIDVGDTVLNNTYSIRIQTDDGHGGVYQKSFIIYINNLPEFCTLPRGGTIANGASVTAYQANSVACSSTCVSEVRTCTNGILSGTYTNQSCSVPSCNVGGGGFILKKDVCPDGDNSPSYYDGTCGNGENKSDGNTDRDNKNDEEQKELSCNFTDKFENAHCFARQFGITTIDDYKKANPEGQILRMHLAKMMVNFSLNILKNNVSNEIPESCTKYADISNISTEMKGYVKMACAMGIMGVDVLGNAQENFNPNGIVSRAEFGTVLSRVLRGDKYNSSPGNRREQHLQALKENNYMTKIDGNRPNYKEIRKYVRLMLQRVWESK